MTEEQISQACTKRAAATSIVVVLLTIAGTFALDRLSKAWALSNLTLHNSQPFIEGFLKLTLTTNTGAAFSLGSNNGGFMTVTAVVLTAALSFWLGSRIARGQSVPVLELIGLSCIIGGSLGNLADRFTQGHVTDFLDFAFFSFPVFNVADTFINIGLGLVLISRLGKGDGDEKKGEDETGSAQASPEKS
ncbi:MAG TPA: signal peptidase II [Candidatus Melainabacteria bacterium]|jgi:signal peptidase II|nr:signal peptidase II [Candidatus Melainabacteria bacterium]HIN65992.1 signal peptidase II [Candidatus Obscuribacterales bacterium]